MDLRRHLSSRIVPRDVVDAGSGLAQHFAAAAGEIHWRLTVKVLVVSSHTLIGRSLIALLQSVPSEEPIKASSCDAATVFEAVHASEPDIVLLEAHTDVPSALATARKLVAEIPGIHIVMLGSEADDASTFEAINSGADGYLTEDVSPDTLTNTLIGVMRGELGLSRGAAMRLVRQLRQGAHSRVSSPPLDADSKLTRREQEIFDLVRRGLRSREIAEQLSIAETTVYKHIQKILDKLQVHSRTQAILVSAERNDQQPGGGRRAPRASPGASLS
jgi:two-component system NarL family response regulator